MKPESELARRTSIRAVRLGEHILIAARGETPTPGYQVDIEQSPLRIFPPRFLLVWSQKPGIWPDVVTPYLVYEVFRFPQEVAEVTVQHADGQDDVPIEQPDRRLLGSLLETASRDGLDAAQTDEATGLSQRLSFDEAFQDALRRLPPIKEPHPDQLEEVQVLEVGGQFGGFAGFRHLFVKIRRQVV